MKKTPLTVATILGFSVVPVAQGHPELTTHIHRDAELLVSNFQFMPMIVLAMLLFIWLLTTVYIKKRKQKYTQLGWQRIRHYPLVRKITGFSG